MKVRIMAMTMITRTCTSTSTRTSTATRTGMITGTGITTGKVRPMRMRLA